MSETTASESKIRKNTVHELVQRARVLVGEQRFGLLVGLVAGVLLLAGWHILSYRDDHVHYHANFALYVNGVRDEFKLPTYYEEVQTCGDDLGNPRARTHFHNNDPSVVHVHDAGATWGALLANLGYGTTDNVLKTSKGTFISGVDGKQLTFLLNGRPVYDIANRAIGDKDVLLISYGTESAAEQQKHYESIPRTAGTHDATSDPATCSGSADATFTDRVKRAFGIPESTNKD